MRVVNDSESDNESCNTSLSTVSLTSYATRPTTVRENGVGVVGGSVILVNTVVGGGISLVATPYAVRCLGLASFCVTEVVFGIMSIISLVLLSHICFKTQQFNMKTLADDIIGKWAGYTVSTAIALNNFSVVVAFIQICGDVVNVLDGDKAYTPILIAAGVAAVTPLAALPHVDRIESIAAVCSLLWFSFVIVLIINFATAIHKHDLSSDWSWSSSLTDVLIGKGLPAVNLTWCCQFNAAPLFGSLVPKTRKSMSTVGGIMSSSAMSLYIVFGLATYLYYGSAIKDDITKSINPNKDGKGLEYGMWLVYTAEVLLGASCMLTIPFFMIESRNMVHEMIRPSDDRSIVRVAETVIMCGLAFGIALAVKDLSIVIAFIGVFPSNIIAWVTPGLLAVYISSHTAVAADQQHIAADTASLPPPMVPRYIKYLGFVLIAFAGTLVPLGIASIIRG